ncbi:MAG: hypothetical protein AAB362_02105 [Patescibacteria group bacterium]
MVSDFYQKVKYTLTENKADIFFAFIVFCIGIIGFGLGRLSFVLPQKTSLQLVDAPAESRFQKTEITPSKQGNACELGGVCVVKEQGIVASKNGTTYYFPWCLNSIKEENKTYFQSEEKAQNSGYRLAKNCSR